MAFDLQAPAERATEIAVVARATPVVRVPSWRQHSRNELAIALSGPTGFNRWDRLKYDLEFVRASQVKAYGCAWAILAHLGGRASVERHAGGFRNVSTGIIHTFEQVEAVLAARCSELGITPAQLRAWAECPGDCYDEIFVEVPADLKRIWEVPFERRIEILKAVVV